MLLETANRTEAKKELLKTEMSLLFSFLGVGSVLLIAGTLAQGKSFKITNRYRYSWFLNKNSIHYT